MKDTLKKTIALIPSYNEARAIGDVVRELVNMGVTALVIDDGSQDDTEKIARDNGAIVLKNKQNMGKGRSVREGLNYAIARPEHEWAVLMDGDGQHHPGDIPGLIEAAVRENADMVLGNRMAQTNNMPIVRLLTNKFTSFVVSSLAGHKIHDSQCGFRLIRVSAFKYVELIADKYDIESEMIIEAARKKMKIVSAPVRTIYGDEVSKIHPFKDTIRFIKLVQRYRRAKKGR
ncbi:MAG: glycosyltransferase family 2 protein [Candidatus Omnitrophica bacterium]|nr:glycosyltransferase family 2 protein [Candidatus Omnitrophota bacterium]